MIMESERLKLSPLTCEQLELMVHNRKALLLSMDIQYTPMELHADGSFLDEFQQALSEFIIPQLKLHPVDYLWYTHWLIVEKSSNTCIGGIGCNGMPNALGQVMIGYFIHKHSEGLGFASEALKCFTDWMLKEPALKYVIADTPADHIASQKVLGNAGFTLLGEVEEGFRWQLENRLHR